LFFLFSLVGDFFERRSETICTMSSVEEVRLSVYKGSENSFATRDSESEARKSPKKIRTFLSQQTILTTSSAVAGQQQDEHRSTPRSTGSSAHRRLSNLVPGVAWRNLESNDSSRPPFSPVIQAESRTRSPSVLSLLSSPKRSGPEPLSPQSPQSFSPLLTGSRLAGRLRGAMTEKKREKALTVDDFSTAETKELDELLLNFECRSELVNTFLAQHQRDSSVQVRFISAVIEIQGISDKSEKRVKLKRIFSLFIQQGSLFRLRSIPEELYPKPGDMESMEVLRAFVLSELIKTKIVIEFMANRKDEDFMSRSERSSDSTISMMKRFSFKDASPVYENSAVPCRE